MNAGRFNFLELFYKNLLIIVFVFIYSCQKNSEKKELAESGNAMTILVQPFQDMEKGDIKIISYNIKKIYPNVKVLTSIPFPENAYYKPRNRYRADSIIAFLRNKTSENFVILGLTTKDISATKGQIFDFGIMGLGYRPGNARIASCFRLSANNKLEQFYKIAIHELGHTQGLPHCSKKYCFMRDAEGKNPTDEEKDFCPKCKNFLKKKNWKFN